MQKAIIIFYEHAARELEYCQEIKKKIEGTNNDISVFICSYHWEKYRGILLLRSYEVIGVMLPFAYSSDDMKYYKIFECRNPEVVLFNPHHEEITTPKTRYLVLPKDEDSKNTMVHLVWTEWFKKQLENVGVDSHLIFVTGNGRNELTKRQQIDRVILSNKYNLDINKKWILYAENRKIDQINKLSVEIGEAWTESYKKTLEQFSSLDETFFEKYELIYRLHPGSSNVVLENSKIRCIKDYSVYDWLKNVDLVLVYSSTVAFEAEMNKVPVLIHNPTNTKQELLQEGLGNYPSIMDLQDINDKIIYDTERLERGKIVYSEYMGNADGSINKIAQCIINMVNNRPKELVHLGTKYSKLYYVSKIARGVLFKMYKTSGLLNILRKPQIIYYNQEDIPY